MAKLTNGPFLIENSCTFDLSTLGLAVGDLVNVICIGGGGGGQSDYYAKGYGAGAMGSSGSTYQYYGPGAGSGYVAKGSFIVTDTSVSVTIGDPGTTTSSGTGGTGGTTSFGSLLSANGGNGARVGNDASSWAAGTGGNNGSSGGNYGAAALGGAGFVNDGFFSVASADTSGIDAGGKGAVFIWW